MLVQAQRCTPQCTTCHSPHSLQQRMHAWPLQVAPVFAIHGLPKTPDTGEKFQEGPGNPTTRQELHALFDVIGTPAWACIGGVQSPAWRSYLLKVRGKAPTLYR